MNKREKIKIKKNKYNNVKIANNSYRSEVFKLLRVLIIVLVIFGIFYLLTLYLTNKSSSSSNSSNGSSTNKDETTISYQKILAGSSFEQDGEYLVLYYDESDSDLKSSFTSMITSYKEKDSYLSIYVVDMSSALNNKYKAEQSNTNPTSIDDLKVNSSTLIKFNNGEVVDYIEGQDSISSYLG